MKSEETFGANAGKVWQTLKGRGTLSAKKIAELTHLKLNDVYAALGWLGREGKIQVISNKQGIVFKLTE